VKAAGTDGTNGTNGITPKLRINATTNYWQVCTTGACDVQNNTGWTNVLDSNGQPVRATGEDGTPNGSGDAIFSGVDASNANYVLFTLAGGGTLQVPKYVFLNITFTQPGTFTYSETKTVAFTTQGADATVKVVNVPANWKIFVNRTGNAGTLTITAPGVTRNDEAFVVIYDAAGNTVMRILDLTAYEPHPSPGVAASEQTWTFGNSPLIWTDVIQVPECDKTSFTGSDTDPHCRSYTLGQKKWYYYNWAYVNTYAATLCPTPWRVPTLADLQELLDNATRTDLHEAWAATGRITSDGTGNPYMDSIGWVQGITTTASFRYTLRWSVVPEALPMTGLSDKSEGLELRCVR
jgi:hypothetical protein